ncbi:hypothetical protein ABT56_07525 [Photobacterium aquae]|uniref:Copper resistance protein n=1 Tax=Photobacterium aquae TaxID=1195763 RepID=A0A0J1H5I6_9GAMM|nr:hypothetical protein [Photobacterium aquae]KLV06988.1 hypothetical protein ABT56_07525 [Photobacterium aquae]
MQLNRQHINNTKITLCLVLFVVLLCSGQHAGILQSCSDMMAQNSAEPPVFNSALPSGSAATPLADITSKAHENTEDGSGCSLAEKLLQHHQQQVSQAIVCSMLLLLVIAIIASPALSFPITTEPIAPSRRRHLTLCVFRE